MRVYCTNPNCQHPESNLIENLLDNINPEHQKYCHWCGTPLILKNRYLPSEEIGSGGFGKTFRAHDFKFEQECAVKILRPRQQLSPSQLQSVEDGFKRGAKILNSLKHQQIPKVYDYFDLKVLEHQKFFYLVQEYIPGQTLAQELANKPYKKFLEDEVVDILRSLLEIILDTHKQHVIHRDIKPQNIIRHRDNGKLNLIDFDSAIKRQLEPGIPVEQSLVMGTPGYAPPEQLSGRNIDHSADLYAIAATCVHLLAGKVPGEMCNTTGSLQKSWKIYVPHVEENFEHILNKMLSLSPEKRYQSAKEVLEALRSPVPIPESQESVQQETRVSPPDPTVWEKVIIFIRNIRRLRWYWYLPILVLLAALATPAISYLINVLNPRDIPPINISCISDTNFSCGEKRLIELSKNSKEEIQAKAKIKGKTAFQEFNEGSLAFQKGLQERDKNAFSDAEKHFTEQLKIYPDDPEARIALNNARAAKNGNFVKIAVCVPKQGIAEEMLRGSAIIQEEINNSRTKLIQGKMLFIQICTDDEDSDQAKNVAKELASEQTIIGVIGHYSSDATLAAGEIYNRDLVAISPTSTAVRDVRDFPLSKYVFRVSPDNSLAAKKLVKYIKLKQQKSPTPLSPAKVAILYRDGDNTSYNRSFRKEFNNEIVKQSFDIVDECNLGDKKNSIKTCMEQAKRKEANFMLIATSNDYFLRQGNPSEVSSSSGDMTLLAGNAIYSEAANTSGFTNKLIIAVQWIRSELPQQLPEVENQANNIFGESGQRVLINYRTAMTYDATKAMVEGIGKIKGAITRDKLYRELKNENFSAMGTNGIEVKFCSKSSEVGSCGESDRKVDKNNKDKLIFLVTPKQTSINGKTQFEEIKLD
jgi:eukaryotic-like serine/threonine-protein kinase